MKENWRNTTTNHRKQNLMDPCRTMADFLTRWFEWRQGNSKKKENKILTLPLVGASSAVMIFMVVVFPAPLCPKSPNTSPGSTASDRDFTAIFVVLSLSSSGLQQHSHSFISLFTYSLCKFYKRRWWDGQKWSKIRTTYLYHDHRGIHTVGMH